MGFALKIYCPATDGFSPARIEEEVVVTDTACKVITRFPAEDLPIANAY
jgi:Xaa-Pro dipeptidase